MSGIKEMEVAYSILPKSRQKGFATEASQKCRDYAFQNNFSQKLISIINTKNPNPKDASQIFR